MYNNFVKPFIFNDEVARVQRDFPDETRDVTFIDLADPDAKEKIRTWYLESSGHIDSWFLTNAGFSSKIREQQEVFFAMSAAEKISWFEQNLPSLAPHILYELEGDIRNKLENGAGVEKSKNSSATLLVIDSKKCSGFSLSDGKTPYLAFYHEVGHIVVPGAAETTPSGLSERDNFLFHLMTDHLRESRADTFSLLYGIRNGVLDKKDIKTVSDSRMMHTVLQGAVKHLTSDILDALPADMDVSDFSPAKIAAFSNQHTEKYSCTDEEALDAGIMVMRYVHHHETEAQVALNESAKTSSPALNGYLSDIRNHFSTAGQKPSSSNLVRYIAQRTASLML